MQEEGQEDFPAHLPEGVLLCTRDAAICLSSISFLDYRPADLASYFSFSVSGVHISDKIHVLKNEECQDYRCLWYCVSFHMHHQKKQAYDKRYEGMQTKRINFIGYLSQSSRRPQASYMLHLNQYNFFFHAVDQGQSFDYFCLPLFTTMSGLLKAHKVFSPASRDCNTPNNQLTHRYSV